MGSADQPSSGGVLVDDAGGLRSADRLARLITFIYPACAAAIATALGALASLAATAAYRVAVWCVVAGAASLAAGLIRHSARVGSWLDALSHWLSDASSTDLRLRSWR